MAEQSAVNRFSLLSWNIDPRRYDVNKVSYLYECKADLYFLQEVKTKTVTELKIKLPEHRSFHWKEKDDTKFNCIIYNGKLFTVYETSGQECALNEKKWPPTGLLPDDKPFESLSAFTENHKDNRVCVAVLQFKNVENQPKVVVASCHVPAKDGSERKTHRFRTEYAKKLLEQLEEMGKKIDCPVIVAGDFNCDLIQNEHVGYNVPKYDPTIHRVICSGGNGNPCIDFFAYKNFASKDVVVKVDNVGAEMAIVENLDTGAQIKDVLSSDKYKFLQYEQRLSKKSTLDIIHKISDHDPLKATLTIQTSSIDINVLYFDLESVGSDTIVSPYLAGLDPKPDLCIFQNVKNSLFPDVYKSFKVHECKPRCFIAYDVSKLTSEEPTSKANVITCKFTCRSTTFTLAICGTNCGKVKGKKKRQEHAKKLFEDASNDGPVVLVGYFYVDLFKHPDSEIPRNGFTVLKYDPTMYRMTHPYLKKPIYICHDFFAVKNLEPYKIKVDSVCTETIFPLGGVIKGDYNVSYDLIKSKNKLLETLSATITISSSPQDTVTVSNSESDSEDTSESESESDSEDLTNGSDSGDEEN